MAKFQKGQSGNPPKQFKPGESGNPGGYSKKSRIQDAYNRLLELPASKAIKADPRDNAATRLARKQLRKAISKSDTRAAIEVTDRTEGKAPQRIQVENSGNDRLMLLMASFDREHEKDSETPAQE